MKVLVFGTFDILHPGHISFFQQAKKYGTTLTVVVARDATVEQVKGRLPKNDETSRLESVAALPIVDTALLGNKGDKYKIIKDVQPDIIALGYDQKAFVDNLHKFLHNNNLSSRIVRLNAFRPDMYKSSYFR